MQTPLATKLREMRVSRGMTAVQTIRHLSKKNFKYKVQSVYKWEQGYATPSIKILKALSEIYHCSISNLIEEHDVEYKNLTPSEIFLLHLYREDFSFRSIAVQLMQRLLTR